MEALIFDTETSGLVRNRTLKLDKQPEIIEFYGCVVNLKTGKIKKEYETLIKPKKPIEEIITKITTITNEQLEDAPPFAKVAKPIKTFLESGKVVIAHNMSFDKDMVDIEFERMEDKVKWPKMLCTVEQTIHIKGFRFSLSALHDHLFGEPFAGAHRAKVDVAALLRCCVKLHKDGVL